MYLHMSKVGRKRLLSQEEINEAHKLRQEGWTKRQLAQKFEIGETTIWENIFITRRIQRGPVTSVETYSFKKLPSVVDIIIKMRNQDMTSMEISGILDIPLNEVNFIFSHNP